MEIINSNQLTSLLRVAQLRELNQVLLSENLANINSDDYQSSSVSFTSMLKDIKLLDNKNLEVETIFKAFKQRDVKPKSIDLLMLESAENQMAHKSLTVAIKSKLQLLQIALKGE